MSPRFINPRVVVAAVAATGALALTATAGGSMQAAPGSSETVIANAHVKVVEKPSGRLVAVSLVNGHRKRLAAGTDKRLVDVDGNYVGVGRGHGARSFDARTGSIAFGARRANVLAVQVRRTGTIVWMADHGHERRVHVLNNGGHRLLGRGAALDPRSLVIADSDATTAYVYWAQRGEVGGAPVE